MIVYDYSISVRVLDLLCPQCILFLGYRSVLGGCCVAGVLVDVPLRVKRDCSQSEEQKEERLGGRVFNRFV